MNEKKGGMKSCLMNDANIIICCSAKVCIDIKVFEKICCLGPRTHWHADARNLHYMYIDGMGQKRIVDR